jgi:hypothetical protein
MPSITVVDLDRMRNALLFEGPERARKLSRFCPCCCCPP